jgi:4'-phosphopantetheinyl transferase
LHQTEVQRALRYRNDADRALYVATRSALRELLAERLSITPATVTLTAGKWGKPMLAGAETGLSFNVSHSCNQALIAISDSRLVGVDIEHVDLNLDWREVASLLCTRHELRCLNAEPTRTQTVSFFRLWTAKEALLKALGVGIYGLQMLDVGCRGEGIRSPEVITPNGVFKSAQDLRYHWLMEFPDYVGCIAFGGNRMTPVKTKCKTKGLINSKKKIAANGTFDEGSGPHC